MRPIYLDYAAGAPVDPVVAEAMTAVITGEAGRANPSSTHWLGRLARERVEQARAQLAAVIGAEPGEIVWTSGATEASNLALKGAMQFYAERGRHLVTSRIEHRSVLDAARWLAEQGCRVSHVASGPGGRIEAEAVAACLQEDTVLVSIQWVNNETGVIHDIEAIAELTRARGVLLHVDAAQALGRVPIDLSAVPVDLLSLTAQKAYGPRGAGALFVRRRPRARVVPLFHGGGHEQGMRSGTLSVHQCVGFALAAERAEAMREAEAERLQGLRERLESGLCAIGGVGVNGTPAPRAAGFSNLSFDGVHGEALKALLGPLCVSSGSACSSATAEPSYVLRALGLDDRRAGASLRISLGRDTGAAEIDAAIAIISAAVRRLRVYAGDEGPAPELAAELPPAFELPTPVWQGLCRGQGLGAPVGPVVAEAAVHSPAHGIELRLRLCADADGRLRPRIAVCGCPYTIACAEYLCRALEQDAAGRCFDAEAMAAALEIPPARRHCVILMEDLIDQLKQTARSPQP